MNQAQRTLVLIVSIVFAAALFTEVSHADESQTDIVDVCASTAKAAGFSGDDLIHEVETCVANEGKN